MRVFMGYNSEKREVRTNVRKPKDYNVSVLYNDKIPVAVFMSILSNIFHKDMVSVCSIGSIASNEGQALIDTYSYDMAHTLVDNAMNFAEKVGYDIRFLIEEA